ncbi:MAG: GIY-YIG nuclease family protein [Terracidiphilus sp.]
MVIISLAVNKQHILDEIRRTAKANGGEPLGRARFEQETGIKYHDWWGKFWARWSEALQEAGFAPNTLRDAFSDEFLLEKLAAFIRELGRFPANGDLRIKKRNDATFPNDKVFDAHFGSRQKLRRAVVEYCRINPSFEDVVTMCGPIPSEDETSKREKTAQVVAGFVYLMKSGKHYKIGKTNAAGRREYELAIQLPERLSTVHVIKTDDPDGIEAYWHRRFAAKRGNGEWFALSSEDVQAFRRRIFM